MPDINLSRLDDPFGCVWYCFRHAMYCEHCDMMGDCGPSGICNKTPTRPDVEVGEFHPT
jgi:hypothetical protein